MNDAMEYKNYIGSIEFSEADGVSFGKVQGVCALISYEGATKIEPNILNSEDETDENYCCFCRRRKKSFL